MLVGHLHATVNVGSVTVITSNCWCVDLFTKTHQYFWATYQLLHLVFPHIILLQKHKLSGANVVPTSQFCIPTLLILTAGKTIHPRASRTITPLRRIRTM
jgi:hypothetical protein